MFYINFLEYIVLYINRSKKKKNRKNVEETGFTSRLIKVMVTGLYLRILKE